MAKRVLIVDDSIVRGTTSRKIVQALRDAGAVEVHMRISSPPVTHPCFFGIDTDNQDQLIAATKNSGGNFPADWGRFPGLFELGRYDVGDPAGSCQLLLSLFYRELPGRNSGGLPAG